MGRVGRCGPTWKGDPPTRAPLAGAVGGVAGLATFLVIHAWWILPIWSIAIPGALIAAGGGAAVGWAYEAHRARLPTTPVRRVAAVTLAGALVLLVSEPISLARGPVEVRVLAQMSLADLWLPLALFLGAAAIVGAAGGALLGRTWRKTGITALAAFLFALGIGHNAPLIGYGFVAAKMWSIMLLATLAAAATLVALDASTVRRPAS